MKGRGSYLRTFENENFILSVFAELLNYDRATGLFNWKNDMSHAVKGGDLAGSIDKGNGYLNLQLSRHKKVVKVKGHRLAWFMVHGSAPKFSLDHIDGNKANNRIENLREATDQQNQSNRSCHRNGFLWGTNRIQGGKYFSSRVYGKYLGNFDTMEKAHLCSVKYAQENNIKIFKEN